LHPLFTAVLALPLLHERLVARQWAGIAVGVVGVGLILAPKMTSVEGVPLHALIVALLATLSLTLGTIWQKRSRPEMDLRVNAAIQFVGAFVLTAPVASPPRPGASTRVSRCMARSRGRSWDSRWAGSRSCWCC
jgi:drug/metabolite transporter (DMT)-like permease